MKDERHHEINGEWTVYYLMEQRCGGVATIVGGASAVACSQDLFGNREATS